jgi:hypothetical protein
MRPGTVTIPKGNAAKGAARGAAEWGGSSGEM